MPRNLKTVLVVLAALACPGALGSVAYAADTHIGPYSSSWWAPESQARKLAPSVTGPAIARKYCGKKARAKILGSDINDCKSKHLDGKMKYKCRRAYKFVCEQRD